MSRRNVLVAAPVREGAPERSVPELLGGGREIASRVGGEVWAAAIGDGAAPAARQLIAQGADGVLTWDDPLLQRHPGEAAAAALMAACAEAQPGWVLLTADSHGRDWGPRLASALGAGLVSECVGWTWTDEGRCIFRRPVYGGKAVQEETVAGAVQLAIVRPGTVGAGRKDAARSGAVRALAVSLDTAGLPVRVEYVRETTEGPQLEDARTIVSGGRGLGGPEKFKLLQELAAVLGGTVGASRAAVDEGWVPAIWQIGLTGHAVRPDLYLAIGISGASQHMVGVSGAKTVVAINTDREAPIFQTARLAVVADCAEILPPLIQASKELLEK